MQVLKEYLTTTGEENTPILINALDGMQRAINNQVETVEQEREEQKPVETEVPV